MRASSHAAALLTAAAALADALTDLSSKRGLAYITGDHAADNQLLASDNSLLTWYYTWSLHLATPRIADKMSFVPLIHGLGTLDDYDVPQVLEELPDTTTHVLAFNEPDEKGDNGGSDLDPEEAAKAYMEHIVPLREGRDGRRRWNISHPVVTGSERGFQWLQDFDKACRDIDDEGCPLDFVAVHYFGDFTGLRNWLEQLRAFYNETSPPFWVTEFAPPQGGPDYTLDMMRESLAYLDDADFVDAYAWFGAFRKDESNEWTGEDVSLFDEDGGLTEVGSLYLGGEDEGFSVGMQGDAGDGDEDGDQDSGAGDGQVRSRFSWALLMPVAVASALMLC